MVPIMHSTKPMVNGSLSLEVKCLIYATGPCNTPKERKNNNEPKVQSMMNLRGFRANTGNNKKPSPKHTNAPTNNTTNPERRSNLDNWNHSGSWGSFCVRGSLFSVSLNVELMFEPKFEKNEPTPAPSAWSCWPICWPRLQLERNSAFAPSSAIYL